MIVVDVPVGQLASVRRDPASRRVVREWRALTGGRSVGDADRRTLVACSGGADSLALGLVLAAAARGSVVLGHVVHDLRPAEETAGERDLVASVASGLGVGFVESTVRVRGETGNAEGNARRERYRALSRLAEGSGCPFVATGHHAEDQLETVLMGLVRGAGAAGLSGVRCRRPLGQGGVTLVRPMLGIGRADTERLCRVAGVGWAEDGTNADVSRLRAALRRDVVPRLLSIRPAGAARAVETATRMRELASLVDDLVEALIQRADVGERAVRWPRAALEGEHRAVVSAALRRVFADLHGGRLADRLPARSVAMVVDAIGCAGGGPDRGRTNRATRRFVWKDTEVEVTPTAVTMRRTGDD